MFFIMEVFFLLWIWTRTGTRDGPGPGLVGGPWSGPDCHDVILEGRNVSGTFS